MPTKHPEVYVRNVEWKASGILLVRPRKHDIVASPEYKGSPAAQIFEGASSVRKRLIPGSVLDLPIYVELAAAGATDYYATSLVFADGGRTFFSFATDEASGFADDALQLFDELAPFLGLRLEIDASRFTLQSLLSVYLGENAAARVVSGSFKRGGGEIIRCAIFFSDMRGFTNLADHTSPLDVVRTLDAYFERVAGPVGNHRGEVLKFIGDAVLAIFPCTSGADGKPDDAAACKRALAAAREAVTDLAALNHERGGEPLALGIALHLGDVMYGNIGARDRLDFTVIGAAVNEASRVEGMCKVVGAKILMTRAFQEAHPNGTVSVGRHALKGVSEEHELFTVDDA